MKVYHETYCEKLGIPDEEPTFEELKDDYRISLQFTALQVFTYKKVSPMRYLFCSFALFQALCMFVQEMHYMTQNIRNAAEEENYTLLEELSEDLKVYELRALTLFKDLDLSQIEDDLSFNDDGDIQSTSPLEEF